MPFALAAIASIVAAWHYDARADKAWGKRDRVALRRRRDQFIAAAVVSTVAAWVVFLATEVTR